MKAPKVALPGFEKSVFRQLTEVWFVSKQADAIYENIGRTIRDQLSFSFVTLRRIGNGLLIATSLDVHEAPRRGIEKRAKQFETGAGPV